MSKRSRTSLWLRRASGGSVRRRWRGVRRRFTGLTIRIFGVNVIPLLILWVGILYLGQYKESLIRAELETLKAQAQLFAGAIAEGAVRPVPVLRDPPDPRLFGPSIPREPEEMEALAPDLSRRMVRRLGETTESRTRLFDTRAAMIGDSFQLAGPGGVVQVTSLKPPPDDRLDFSDLIDWGGEMFGRVVPLTIDLPPYPVCQDLKARTCPDVTRGLDGRVSASAWKDPDGGILLSAAAPVQKIKQVIGVVLLTKNGQDIEDAMVKVRKDFLRVFLGALLLTFLLSLYLSRVIGKPLKRLADAAEAVRLGRTRGTEIPDLSRRRDEIGELSLALRDMTRALWNRMDSIESFAADVAHEIKNPLTSLRSAVETAARIPDPQKRDQLMAIVLDDVKRLDRLISDISSASRLDAELSREELEPVDLGGLLAWMCDAFREPLARAGLDEGGRTGEGPVRLELPETGPVMVAGNQGRLAQVFRNLLSNALSFSPPGGMVTVRVLPGKGTVSVQVDDQGSGIPENRLEKIFERFYTERPAHETYGQHSGLGLSIVRQIVAAHGGEVRAENRRDEAGQITGARFTVILNTV